jgi:MFS family permease
MVGAGREGEQFVAHGSPLQRAPAPRRALFHYHRNVYLLLLFTLGKGFQLSIAALATNLYVYSLGYRQDFIGLLSAIPALGSLVASVPMGLLADRLGRKPLLILSGLLNPLAIAAIGLSANAPLLITASLCNGFLSTAYWVTNLPMLTECTSDDQRVGVLALNSFLLLGVGALGALLGGAVPELVAAILRVPATSVVPLRWGVLAAAIITFLPAPPLLFLREPQRMRSAPAPPAIPAPSSDAAASAVARPVAAGESPAALPFVPATDATAGTMGLRSVTGQESQARAPRPDASPVAMSGSPIADPVGRWAVVALFLKLLIPDMLFTTGEGAVLGLLQLFFLLRFGVQPGTLGVLFTVAGLGGGATSLLAPRLVRRWGKLRTALAMQYLSVPAMLAIGFLPAFPLAASAEFARRVLRGFFDPVYATFAMESVSTRWRATLSGFYNVTWSLGFSVGPGIAGYLQQHVGLSASFVVGAGCVATAATLLLVFFRPRAPEAKAE